MSLPSGGYFSLADPDHRPGTQVAVPDGAGKRETTYHQPPCPKLRPSTRARPRPLGRAGFPSTSNGQPQSAGRLGARASPQRLGASWYVHCGHAGFLEEGTVRFPSKSCLGSLEPATRPKRVISTGDACEARHAHSRVRCSLCATRPLPRPHAPAPRPLPPPRYSKSTLSPSNPFACKFQGQHWPLGICQLSPRAGDRATGTGRRGATPDCR